MLSKSKRQKVKCLQVHCKVTVLQDIKNGLCSSRSARCKSSSCIHFCLLYCRDICTTGPNTWCPTGAHYGFKVSNGQLCMYCVCTVIVEKCVSISTCTANDGSALCAVVSWWESVAASLYFSFNSVSPIVFMHGLFGHCLSLHNFCKALYSSLALCLGSKGGFHVYWMSYNTNCAIV